MKEEFLHYIWKYSLYKTSDLFTQNQEKVEIINPGTHNHDAGPDFFNAKIKIDDTIWAGNVEIHIKSSDWYSHKHNGDKAYDNVVLQVVNHHDKDIFRSNGEIIPTVQISFDQHLLDNYEELIQKQDEIPCNNYLRDIDSFKIKASLGTLAVERLEQKAEQIKTLLDKTENSWETAFYHKLANNFGFKLNSQPFEMLAKSLPLNYLAKHKDNLMQIEALLFGQAGFLNDEAGDNYYQGLRKEYQYLKKKFDLKPIEPHLWKFLRSRPGNFPTIRLAQFTQLIYKSSALFSKILETDNINDFYKLFEVEPSPYWLNHYTFNKESVEKKKSIGKSAIHILLINTVVPFLFVFGKQKGIVSLQDKALELLETVKAESNNIVKKWIDLGIQPENAFESQALIQLRNQYCNQKKCLNCQIGNIIINRK